MIRRKGEFLFGVSPCLAALRANRRKIHSIYMKPGVAQRQGAARSRKEYLVTLPLGTHVSAGIS